MPQKDDPRSIGGYRLVGRLGSGGMGVVYRGRARSGREVAVKVVHAQYAEDAVFRARFRQEIEAVRKVSGAFTAPVLDADPEAVRPWMATQYVPGPSLAALIRDQGPLRDTALRRLALGLVEALREIHRVGVVHRDLKPANVLMAEDGPRVIDFGISRAAEDHHTLTETGQMIGTPPFMSPEQLTDARSVGPASDVFSVGSLLVYTSTGRGPFDADSPYLTAYRVAHDEPVLDGVPQPLRPLLERCLAKDPAGRPALDELARELVAALPETGADDEATVALRRDETALDGTRPAEPPAPGPPASAPGGAASGSGRAVSAPGLAGSAPGLAGSGPGRAVSGPGRAASGPGHAGAAPDPAASGPGLVGSDPGLAVSGPGGVASAPGLAVSGPGGAVSGPGLAVSGPGGAVSGPGLAVSGPGPAVSGPGLAGAAPGLATSGPGRAVSDPGPTASGRDGAASGPGLVVSDPRPAVSGGRRGRARRWWVTAGAASALALGLTGFLLFGPGLGEDDSRTGADTTGSTPSRWTPVPAGWKPWQTTVHATAAQGVRQGRGIAEGGSMNGPECAVYEGAVHCAGDGVLPVRLDALTGRARWRAGVLPPGKGDGGYSFSVLGITDDAMLVEQTYNPHQGDDVKVTVAALDTGTGRRLWQRTVDVDAVRPYVSDGLVIVPDDGGRSVTARAPRTGAGRWTAPLPAGQYCGPADTGERPYLRCVPDEVPSKEAVLLRLDPSDGSARRLTVPVDDTPVGMFEGRLVLLEPTEDEQDEAFAGIRLLDPVTGRDRAVRLAEPLEGDATLSGGTVWFATSSGEVTAVSVRTGERLWRTRTSLEQPSGIIHDPRARAVYLSSASGRVAALDAAGGTLLWETLPRARRVTNPGWSGPEALLHQGALVVATTEGDVFTLDPAHPGRKPVPG
ncbi:protein kinase [Streptomyces sp. NPDC093516]|uniref:protein kinase domain-containing protein n=1 Tax=Streptomyces sp. NPDC093516 TaxID=3155304 RepID=UPI00341AA5C3